MRRGLRKTKQVIAGILSAALLMTSIPQNSTYVYASEQAEVQATDELHRYKPKQRKYQMYKRTQLQLKKLNCR